MLAYKAKGSSMKQVLLIVTGASPQVLTETLYALNLQGKPLPEEIFVITTQGSKELLVKGLFEQEHYFNLLKDYQLPDIKFNEDNIWVIEDDQGNLIEDAKTEVDQTYMADFITRKVFELTSDENISIHASIAGGRKTMAFYLGYAMSLLGREQDSLSHVFINDEFEFLSEFYYPTPYSKPIKNERLGKFVDCRDAIVTLAEIPFVRMRTSLNDDLITNMQHASFSQTVASLNSINKNELILKISTKAKTLKFTGIEIKLTAKELAFYLWLIDASNSELGAVVVDRYFEDSIKHAENFLDKFKILGTDSRVYNKFNIEPEDFKEGVLGNLQPMQRDFVQQTRSQINKKIIQQLPKVIAEKIQIQSISKEHETHYKIDFKSNNVSMSLN